MPVRTLRSTVLVAACAAVPLLGGCYEEIGDGDAAAAPAPATRPAPGTGDADGGLSVSGGSGASSTHGKAKESAKSTVGKLQQRDAELERQMEDPD